MKFLFTFFTFTLLTAQSQPSFTLSDVKVLGNTSTSNNMVLYTAGLQKGQDVTAEDFRRAVKRLWDLGVFSDVQIEFDGETSEGISISIQVEESPVLSKIEIIGNKKIKDLSLIHISEPTRPY